MSQTPTVVLGIQDRRTREWIQSIVVAAGYRLIVKDGPVGLHELTPDGGFYFVIGETGNDVAALDELYRRLQEQFRGHWDEIFVVGILQRQMSDAWWFKWSADYGDLPKVTNIARQEWKGWKHSIPLLLSRLTKSEDLDADLPA